jgi:hypothetical protein
MNRLLVSAAAVALVLVCRVAPADAHTPAKGGSSAIPKGGSFYAPKLTVLPSKGVSPKLIVSPASKTVISPTYLKYQQTWCKNPNGTIIGTGFCFPRHCCPVYTRSCYSVYWGCYLYFLPSCDVWVYYCPVDCYYYQVTLYP